ncbi:MAG: flagellar protein [Lachnospiraceae bacterium]|nr:flagellar protein [Lachnospiraceae bacterium]
MNVRNCKNCRRLFNYIAGPHLCPSCREELEEKFQVVKKYVQEHKGAGIPEVAEECEVDPQQIHQWIREERLEFTDTASIGLGCERCGKIIKSGRYCDECKLEMAGSLNAAKNSISSQLAARQAAEANKSNGPRMRFK